MTRREIEDENIRNIQKSKRSYCVTLPIRIMRKLKWRERQKVVVTRLREDRMDAVEALGVRPMHYNGLHRAWLNQTNADVKTFKTREECIAWCAETNRRLGTEDLEQTGNHISIQLERQQAVVKAAETTGKVLQRQANLVRLRMKEGYTDPTFGEPVARAFERAAKKLQDALDAPPEGEG